MKIAIASDFSGFLLKEAVRCFLLEKGYQIQDVGQKNAEDKLLYFEAAANLAKAVQSGECDRGIVICGTGAGVSMIANKFRGVYCVPCESLYTAEKISLINNANVLAMGEKIVSPTMAGEMALAFLGATWCEGFEEQRRKNNENGYRMLKQIEDDF
ncbi:MAG: RpiB/LacA/LacB family sugar-phosphate isomerase [Defluviitaleaceae bacterium]|nr:RpiB/LacA/LacB family sugar-phosphate isomerase [Defluviitaleaceae bacterium]